MKLIIQIRKEYLEFNGIWKDIRIVSQEKPEVLRLTHDGVEYKCWAESKEAMLSLVNRIRQLQQNLASPGSHPRPGECL